MISEDILKAGVDSFKIRRPKDTELQKNSPEMEAKIQELGPFNVLLKWTAPSRPQISLPGPKFLRSMKIIGLTLGLIFLLLQEWLLIIFISCIVFFIYAISRSSIEEVPFEINTHGLLVEGIQYYWFQLSSFYVRNHGDLTNFSVIANFRRPFPIFLNVSSSDYSAVFELLSSRLRFIDAPTKDFVDGAFDSLKDKFNYEQ